MITQTKNQVSMSKAVLCSPRTETQTDTQTHRHTDTKVTTVGTLSGFHEFFLQSVIKDRPKNMTNLMPLLVNLSMDDGRGRI